VATVDEDLAFAGPAAASELVRSGHRHPRELVEASLRAIEALDPRLNAFRTLLADEALAAAERVPADLPLAGVPIAIKADTPLAGQPTMRGSRT
jgi:amidase